MKRRKHTDENLETADDIGPRSKKSKTKNESSVKGIDSVEGENESASRRRSGRLGAIVPLSEDGSAHSSDEREPHIEVSKDHGNADAEQESGIDVGGATAVLNTTPRRGRPKAPLSEPMSQVKGNTPSKKLLGKGLFSTPVKAKGAAESNETPRIERNADRSARRKSTRALIERTVLGNNSDNDDEDQEIAQHIYDSGEDEDLDGPDLEEEIIGASNAPETPSRRTRKPKGPKPRQRSRTPPLSDFSAHEKYFSQNKGKIKTSDNNLSSLALLDHEEYFNLVRGFKDPHAKDVRALQDLHSRSFSQWQFELSQDFNICLYGWGSKRSLLMRFADHISKSQSTEPVSKIVVANGYVHNLTIRDVLNTLASAISGPGQKIGSHAAEMVENVIALLEENTSQRITLIIHSIDRMPLRRPAAQVILSRLAAVPQIHLVASADHPSFPLLWDSSLRSTYNFLFHDCTTLEPYAVEIDVVDEVHELLGRSGRRVGGKEGVSFVLKSLPENAKNLFRVLIGEQLSTMDGSYGHPAGGLGDEDDDEQRFGCQSKTEIGVEYRVLYQKAVEEFICSNEMNFRTLLKEFHDHQMIESRKDALGAEILSVPFRKEELETILEDIMS